MTFIQCNNALDDERALMVEFCVAQNEKSTSINRNDQSPVCGCLNWGPLLRSSTNQMPEAKGPISVMSSAMLEESKPINGDDGHRWRQFVKD